MKKKLIISILATTAALCGAIGFAACEDGDNANNEPALVYEYRAEEDYWEITGIGTVTDNEIVIPSTFEGKPVGSIGRNVFASPKLTSVTIPDSIINIGEGAFSGCSGLTVITIPGSVKYIGEKAFDGSGLTAITIPDSVTTIGKYAFNACEGLTSATIGKGVTSISEGMFESCSNLTSVTLPDKLTSIGDRVFENCNKLNNITIPEKVTSIGFLAFGSCKKLTSITVPDSVTDMANSVFSACESLTSVTLSQNITVIGDDAFWHCGSLTEIVIPDKVTSIGRTAFLDCNSLKDITIGNGVKTIDDSAFTGCGNIESVAMPVSAISNIINLTRSTIKTVEVTSGDAIGEYAFSNCTNLTKIILPNTITSIGNNAFSECTSLTKITIPQGVSVIGEYAFANCDSMQYNEYDNALYLGNSVNPYMILVKAANKEITSCNINEKTKFIHSGAFDNCSKLIEMSIPESVTSFGIYMLNECRALTDVNYSGTKEQWKAIEKHEHWDEQTLNFAIHCSDGDLTRI